MDIILENTPQKQCTKCEKPFPATTEYFPYKKRKYKGLDKIYLYGACRQCAKEANHAKYLLAKANPPEVPPDVLIVCSACEKSLPATEDFFDRNPMGINRYGFASECKPCKTAKAYARRRTPKGKARESELRKQRYDANPEHFRRQRMRYFYVNKEIENERNRIYCHAHHAERSQQRRIYRHTHPGSRKGEEQNRRAHKKAVPGTHTPAQIQEQLKRQHYRCYYAACAFSKFKKVKGQYIYVVEHTFPLSRVVGTNIPANDMSYLVLACPKCNGEKYDKFPWEWPAGGRLL